MRKAKPRAVGGIALNGIGVCRLAALAYGIILIIERGYKGRIPIDPLVRFSLVYGDRIAHAAYPTKALLDAAEKRIELYYEGKTEDEIREELEARRRLNISLAQSAHKCPICQKKKKKEGPCAQCPKRKLTRS